MKLAKWHGAGNDYLILEEALLPAPLTPAAITLLCDRHFGVGSDGILLHTRPTGAVLGAVARMRIFNPDASEPEMCGNGIRIFARYLVGTKQVCDDEFTVETLAGPIRPRVLTDGSVRVDMGVARFMSGNVARDAIERESVAPGGGTGAAGGSAGSDAASGEVVNAPLEAGGRQYRFTFVDVGNPHCVIFVDDPTSFDVAGVGALIERHPFFPNRVNVEFVHVELDGSIRMRVWERGVGETLACGTGATAVGAACVRLGRAKSPVLVHVPGGDLTIEVGMADANGARQVHLTGPAEEVFTCELSRDLLRRLGWPAPTD